MKEFLSGNGEASSKRLFLFILICLYSLYFISNLFFHLQLKDTLEENMFYLIIVMFCGVGLEKWSLSGLFTTSKKNDVADDLTEDVGGTNPPPGKGRG